MRENRERRRPVKEEYGLIFDGSPTVIDKPAKPVAGSSKHPDDTDIIDGELIY